MVRVHRSIGFKPVDENVPIFCHSLGLSCHWHAYFDVGKLKNEPGACTEPRSVASSV